MEQKLHTPEGVRDIYNRECETKLTLQKKLETVLHLYGYQDIQTPTFEYDDVFRKARAAATLFEGEELPIRLCYVGNTFINHSSYQGRLKENTQMGAELIGLDSVEADAEMLAMVVDGMKKTGLTEFQVNIGHVDFIQSLLEATGLEEEEKDEIRELIANRNYFGVEEILDNRSVRGSVKEAFRILPELVGGQEILERAARIAPTVNARLALTRLQQIYRLLMIYKAEEHITFDLSMSGSYGYYTGIIFRAYTYGTGDAVVRGGRYDHLLGKFGKNTPSIGFAIIVDELMSALNRQKIAVETSHRNLLVYTEETQRWAIFLARDFREKGKNIEMLKREQEDRREKYEKYGKRSGIISMLYLRDDFKIEMVNLRTGEEKIIDAKKKRR